MRRLLRGDSRHHSHYRRSCSTNHGIRELDTRAKARPALCWADSSQEDIAMRLTPASAIVGIENPACLLEFEKSQSHFPELQKSLVLVLRWCWGTAWNDWLSQWEGNLFYFPDYDPAGLRIFEHEVLDKNPKASLLIPPNLEFLLRQRGQREIFLIQERFLPVSHTHPQINFVADLLRKTRRGLEQEHLLY